MAEGRELQGVRTAGYGRQQNDRQRRDPCALSFRSHPAADAASGAAASACASSVCGEFVTAFTYDVCSCLPPALHYVCAVPCGDAEEVGAFMNNEKLHGYAHVKQGLR